VIPPPRLFACCRRAWSTRTWRINFAAYRKKVRPVLQRQLIHIHESQVDLMHERRRLQGVTRLFAPEIAARHAAELVIHERGPGGRAPPGRPGARTGAGPVTSGHRRVLSSAREGNRRRFCASCFIGPKQSQTVNHRSLL
jgi:hypothetical protein